MTKIEWTDFSWPLANGCSRVSPGCQNCYAERLAATRLKHHPKYKSLAVMRNGQPRWTGEVRFWEADLDKPLRRKKPARWFVADMGDLFYEGFTNEQIAAVYGVMAACRQHEFQVLSKRPASMLAWYEWIASRQCDPVTECHAEALARDPTGLVHTRSVIDDGRPWPLPNVHLGVSVERQKEADERIPLLLRTPAAVHWVSAEPLLGPVDLAGFLAPSDDADDDGQSRVLGATASIDWIVAGGESGPRARPCDVRWIEDIVEQCRKASVPCFVKQLGSRPKGTCAKLCGRGGTGAAGLGDVECELVLKHPKGSDPREWPDNLNVREFPEVRP